MVTAAVRAAVLAKAPRRTVSAVAAAVACALGRPAAAVATRVPVAGAPGGATSAAGAAFAECTGGASAEALLAALRSARTAQRQRKKVRRKAGQVAARLAAHEVDGAALLLVPHHGGDSAASLPPDGADGCMVDDMVVDGVTTQLSEASASSAPAVVTCAPAEDAAAELARAKATLWARAAAQMADAGRLPCVLVGSDSAAAHKEQLMSLRVGLPRCCSLPLQVLDRLINRLGEKESDGEPVSAVEQQVVHGWCEALLNVRSGRGAAAAQAPGRPVGHQAQA